MSEHAVIIQLKLSDDGFGSSEERESMHALQDELTTEIEKNSAGELDGDEFGGGTCTIYTYGPDADQLYAAMEPVLRKSKLSVGAVVTKRYGEAGDDDAHEEEIKL